MCAWWLDLEDLSLLKNCSLFRFSSAFKRVIENDWGKLQIDAFCCWSAVSWGILGLEGRKGYLADKYTFITLMLWLGLNERVILTSRLVKVVKPMQCNTLIVCIKAVFSVSFRSIHDLHNRVVRLNFISIMLQQELDCVLWPPHRWHSQWLSTPSTNNINNPFS